MAVLAAAVTANAAPAGPRSLRLTAQGLSADLADVSLRHVLDTIAREARVRIVTDTPTEMRVTARFRDLPLEDALKRLLRSDALVFIYAPAEAGSTAARARLMEVRAYVGSARRAGDLTGSNDTPVAAVKPAEEEDTNDGVVVAPSRSLGDAPRSGHHSGGRRRCGARRRAHPRAGGRRPRYP